MSENEELIADDVPPASAFQLHRESSYIQEERSLREPIALQKDSFQ